MTRSKDYGIPRYNMDKLLTILMALLITPVSGCSPGAELPPTVGASENAPTASANGNPPVLVELFTSEGCSSCPPADRVLASLPRDEAVSKVRVITLGFHVDYWDYLGWKDRFSSPDYSRRQEAYARSFRIDSVYTPQMVIDGSNQFVGSNRLTAIEAVKQAGNLVKGIVDLRVLGDKLQINVGELPKHSGATVYLAVAENNLVTKVERGENSKRTLEHAAVVREFSAVGRLAANAKTQGLEYPLDAKKDWRPEHLKLVVFVQDDVTLKILAVNEAAWVVRAK